MTTIRTATNADTNALDRLAQLDSSQVPAGELLVAEIDGNLVAALSTTDGSVIADPFTYTNESVALLRRRAEQADIPRRRRVVVPHLAHRAVR
jgi:hypothetical protein